MFKKIAFIVNICGIIVFICMIFPGPGWNSTVSVSAFPSTRNVQKWPLAANSPWNMPIHNNASYVPGNITKTDPREQAENPFEVDMILGLDTNWVYYSKNSDPAKTVYKQNNFKSGRCTSDIPANEWEYITSSPYNIQIPNNAIIPDGTDNNYPNSSAAIIESGGKINSFNYAARCQAGGNFYASPLNSFAGGVLSYQDYVTDQNIKGAGIWGGHGGSALSSVGGNIIEGELTNDEPIRHVLSMDIPGNFIYGIGSGNLSQAGSFSDQDKPNYFRWPAITLDGCGPCAGRNGYHGTQSELKMGALLAINPNITAESLGLKTKAAKKIFQALKDYGTYVVDNTGWNSFDLNVNQNVEAEFKNTYGFNMGGYKSSFDTSQSGDWYNDMTNIYSNLSVVANNSKTNVGGGPNNDFTNRRSQMAPCFEDEAGCGGSSSSSSSSISSSLGLSSSSSSSDSQSNAQNSISVNSSSSISSSLGLSSSSSSSYSQSNAQNSISVNSSSSFSASLSSNSSNISISNLNFADIEILGKTICPSFENISTLDSIYIQFNANCSSVGIKTYWLNLDPSQNYNFIKYNPNSKEKIANFNAKIGLENYKGKNVITSIHSVIDNGNGDFNPQTGRIYDPYTLEPQLNIKNEQIISKSDTQNTSKNSKNLTVRSGGVDIPIMQIMIFSVITGTVLNKLVDKIR